jgi:hypothetical protein
VTILLLLCFGVPSHWIKAFFSPLGTLREPSQPRETALEIMPLPVIEIETPLPATEQPRQEKQVPESWRPDPAWWAAVWQMRLEATEGQLVEPDSVDTLPGMPFWLSPTIAITNDAFVDTSREHKLTLYMLRERENFVAQKSYLLGQARQRLYRDLLNTTARLYDEFLYEEISVPDPDRNYDKSPQAKQSGKLAEAR